MFLISSDQLFSASQNDMLYKIFGQLRKDIGAFCYLKADQYFHRGSHHADGHKNCSFETHDNDTEKHSDCEHHLDKKTAPEKPLDLFAKVYKAIHFRPVLHLGSFENAEILPWFDITTRFNPHFINAYLDGGFWLNTKMNQPDKALAFLRRGLKYNPLSWQIVFQMGEIYFTKKKDYAKSYSYFKHAYYLMNPQPHTMLEEKSVLLFLSASAQKINKQQESLNYKKKLSQIQNQY
ncbi:MAG: hypothetical protein KAS13_04405 [Candidatus Omnitrophica bacterium]|nr:hypothetical protein [Candidatus Omnitrophota bacterium]